jgi:MFS family permease
MIDAALERPVRPIGMGFATAYGLAQIGAFTCFVPLLQVLTPLKAAAIDPANKTTLLGTAVFWGAIVASLANLLAGVISDHTRSRFGRRRPWLVAGLAGSLVAYWLIYQAKTPLGLILGIGIFQLAFNFLYSALVAILPDRVPDSQKGKVSAIAVLGFPVGSVVGATIVGRLFNAEAARYLALSVAVIAALLPLILGLEDAPLEQAKAPLRWSALLRSLWVDPRTHRDFAFAWAGRLLVLVAHSVVQAYLLFYLQDSVRYSHLFPGRSAEEGLSVLLAACCATSVAGAMIAGLLSDKMGRRKGFVTVGALLMAGAMVGLALAPTWEAVIAAYLVYGLGSGCFNATDTALVAQVLPRARDVGKDLGIVNLSNTLPQAAAPVIAIWLLGALHADYRSLFLTVAAVGVAGGLLVLPIRSVR